MPSFGAPKCGKRADVRPNSRKSSRPVGRRRERTSDTVRQSVPDDAFLHILVRVNLAKEEAKGRVVEEAAVATAVPCSEAGHANQALNRASLLAPTRTRVAREKSCVPKTIRLGAGITPSV